MQQKTNNPLAEIQAQLKAPKGQYNSFGKYHYRSAEDILEAVKKVVNPMGFSITLTDRVTEIGGRIYVEATATLFNGELEYSATGLAREEETKKGMDGSQITGAASSYARKYALNGLFAIDDTKDSDATNQGTKDKQPAEPAPAAEATQISFDDQFKLLIHQTAGANTLDKLNSVWLTLSKSGKENKEIKQLFSNRKAEILNSQQ